MEISEIRVVLVDDSAETRENVKKLLNFEGGIRVVGEAEDGAAAVEVAKRLRPDCMLMDINMPGVDGIEATKRINQALPHTVIITMSVQGEQEYLRKAMIAGARDFLTKPFAGDDLVNTIKQTWEIEEQRRSQQAIEQKPQRQGKVIVVFSAKGGVGKTTLAVNLGVAVAERGQEAVLVDLDLMFGDVPIMLNLSPDRTVRDWITDVGTPIEGYLTSHASGLRVLAAPDTPEEGELVTADHVGEALNALRPLADYIIVDTPQFFVDSVLQSLEQAEEILLVATSDLPNLKNVRRCLDILEKLQLGEKTKVVINRISRENLPVADFDKHVNARIYHKIPADSKLAADSANQGIPAVTLGPRSRLAHAISDLAATTMGQSSAKPAKTLRFNLW